MSSLTKMAWDQMSMGPIVWLPTQCYGHMGLNAAMYAVARNVNMQTT